jgi:hypothetical protein
MTRAIGAGDRAAAGGQAIQIFARLLVRDGDAVWRDLTMLGPDDGDWFVRAEWGASIDDPVVTARFTVLREQLIGGVMKKLAPQISASAYNRNAANAYSPLINPGRSIRLLTATVAPGTDPSTHWKRVFDGKIDGVDPGGDDGTMVVRCRDRGAWLLDTQIETVRHYGSLAGVPVQTVMQSIIDDNGVPALPVIDTPVDPVWLIHPFDQPNKISVMEAIRAKAQQIGFDLRWDFLTDGDVDPVLIFSEPARTKTVPDWTFGATEYLEIPRSELTDDDVRNAVTVAYLDAVLGQTIERNAVNAASIAAFNRRWMRIGEDSTSNIDSSTEADKLAAAIVADLGFPKNQHSMQTLYAWFLSLGDLVRYLANDVHYDEDQDLAITSFQHTIEEGHGTTIIEGRGTPAGAYRRWLTYAEPTGGTTGNIALAWQKISETDNSITVEINATLPGSGLAPLVSLQWTGTNPPVTRLSGPDVGIWVASGQRWTFTKPNPGQGASGVGFAAAASGTIATVFLNVPIPEGTAFAGPTLDDPALEAFPDPTNEFSIDSTPHAAPSGAVYKAYWRLATSGSWTVESGLSAPSFTVEQIEHHQVIADSGTPNSIFQAYVEMYSSAGDFLAQSSVAEIEWTASLSGG